MKIENTLLLILWGWAGIYGQAVAQAPVISFQEVQRATGERASHFQLDAQQEKSMYEIQRQRLLNLAAIANLKNSDYDIYLRKKRAIRLYAEAATRRLLTPVQQERFASDLRARERERSALLAALKARGAGPAEREAALLRLEVEWE